MAENLRQTFQDIADAIRDRLDVKEYPIKPVEFADEVRYIPQSSGGGHYQDPSEILEGTITYCSNSASFIKPYTFGFCPLLSEVDFSKCKTIGSRAFENCYALESISFPMCEEVGSYAFQNCSKLTEVSFPACKVISLNAFLSCINISYISLPECSLVSANAFANCRQVSSLYLPKCNFLYGGNLSMSNSLITSLDLPECYSIGYWDINSCPNLSYYNLPKCEMLEINGFPYNSGILTTINLSNVILCTGWGTVNTTAIPNYSYLLSGADCFRNWSNVSYVSLPNLLHGGDLTKLVSNGILSHSLINYKYISLNASYAVYIRSCADLTNVSLPALARASNGCFSSDYNLTKVDLPQAQTLSDCFCGCSSLSELFLPAATYIYGSLFSNCINLSKIVFLEPSIDLNTSSAFKFSPIADSSYLGYFGSIYVLPSRVSYFQSSRNWSYYKSRITAIPEAEMLQLTSDYIFRSEFQSSTLSEIPSERANAKYIMASAFQGCSNLTSINFPNCSIIRQYAFSYCLKLSQISLPQCKYISEGAFRYCQALTSVNLPQVLIMSGAIFDYCQNLSYISAPECRYLYSIGQCYNLESIYLPKCLSLAGAAFYNCSKLSYAVFRDLLCMSVSSEATGIFNNCKNLWSVYILGSLPIWFYSYNIDLTGSAKINTFKNTPLTQLTYSAATGQSEYGKIYVRASLVSEFKALNYRYSEIQDRFTGLTDEEADNILNILDSGGTL